MGLMKTANTLAETVLSGVNKVAPFGKFERLTAGFCMAIPLFLLITGTAPDKRNFGLLVYPIMITFLMPFIIPLVARIFKDKQYHGVWLTTIGGLALFCFYWLFARFFELDSKPSISAYVTMEDSHIFGMVLAIAAMLFMANGVVYWDEIQISEAKWRRWLTIVLGILLLGVIIFPYNTMATTHLVFAGLFFAGCAIGTAFRTKVKERKPNETKGEYNRKKFLHWFFDLLPLAIMAGALLMYFGPELGWWRGSESNPVNLFGAESIALWITGLDFTLVSLKRQT